MGFGTSLSEANFCFLSNNWICYLVSSVRIEAIYCIDALYFYKTQGSPVISSQAI